MLHEWIPNRASEHAATGRQFIQFPEQTHEHQCQEHVARCSELRLFFCLTFINISHHLCC